MSRDLNEVTLIGRLGADPEMRYTANGQAVTSISLCTNNTYRTADGELHDEASWHRLVIWGKQGEAANSFLRRGSRVWVRGRLQYRQWKDKDNNVRYSTDVVVSDCIFLDAAKPANGHRPAEEVELL